MILSPAERKQIRDQRRVPQGQMLVTLRDGQPMDWQIVTVIEREAERRETCAPALGRR